MDFLNKMFRGMTERNINALVFQMVSDYQDRYVTSFDKFTLNVMTNFYLKDAE